MPIKSVPLIKTNDRSVEQAQNTSGQLIQELIQNPLTTVSIISNVSIKQFQSNLITHKLGAVPKGWLIIRKQANSIIWEDTQTNVDPSNLVIFNSDLDDIIDILVF